MNKEILYRFFDGIASEEEKKDVRAWSDASSENMKELLNERKIYNALLFSNIDDAITQDKQPEHKLVAFFKQAGKYAAVAAITCCGFWMTQHLTSASKEYNEIIVPIGQYTNVILADGSCVYLNSGTKFKYPTSFNKKERTVEMDGEGYFEVKHKKDNQPFIVKTPKGNVRVLGTKFNLEAYATKKEFVTYLMEGEVEVNANEQTIRLLPNEKAFIDNDNLIKQEFNEYKYNWTGDVIKFNDYNFIELMKEFNKIFGLNVEVSNKLVKKYNCTGKFRRSDGIEYALKILQLEIPFNYEYDFENRTIFIN